MEFLQLQYFQALAHDPHMTRVAQNLHITQSALSKMIKSLETSIDVKLFDREGRRLILNENGKIFLRHVERGLREINEGVRVIQERNGCKYPEINLYTNVVLSCFADIVAGFKTLHPGVNINVFAHGAEQHIATLNRINFSILHVPANEPPPEQAILLLEEPFLLAVSQSSPLAGRRSVRLEELANEPFIKLPSNGPYQKTVDYFCSMAGFHPHTAMECSHTESLFGFVRTGLGIALFPALTWRFGYMEGIQLIPVASDLVVNRLYLTQMRIEECSEIVTLFQSYVQEFFSRL